DGVEHAVFVEGQRRRLLGHGVEVDGLDLDVLGIEVAGVGFQDGDVFRHQARELVGPVDYDVLGVGPGVAVGVDGPLRDGVADGGQRGQEPRGRRDQLDLERVVVEGGDAERVHVGTAGVDALGAFDDVDAVRHRRGGGGVGDAAERVDVVVRGYRRAV